MSIAGNNKDSNNYQKRKYNLGGERAATLRLYNHQPSLHPIKSTKMAPLVNPCSSAGNISTPGRREKSAGCSVGAGMGK